MKLRTSPTTVQVVGPLTSRPRNQRLPARPQCFTQIWRDCGDGTVYYVFHDGSIYQYLMPAIDDAVAVILADVHGQRFNLSFRRAALDAATFMRVTTVPGTAALIYNPPPYAGVDPGPCPSGFCGLFSWSTFGFGIPGPAVFTYNNAVNPCVLSVTFPGGHAFHNGESIINSNTVTVPGTTTWLATGTCSAADNDLAIQLILNGTTGAIQTFLPPGPSPISMSVPVTTGDTVAVQLVQIYRSGPGTFPTGTVTLNLSPQ